MGKNIIEKEIEFDSEGITCRGLFVKPEGVTNAPLMVIVHGLGGIYEMRLDAYAKRFAEEGYACLTFDYRYFGKSDGDNRHWLVKEYQQQDIETAIEFGKTLEGVDSSRVILWGTSLGGGHIIDVSARRKDIVASIIQGPFTDGIASVMAISIPSSLGVTIFAAIDAIGRLFGRKPLLVPLAGTYGIPALMTSRDAGQDVLKLFPKGTVFSKQLSNLYNRVAKKTITLPENISLSDKPEKYSNTKLTGSIILPSGSVLINGVSAIFGMKIIAWRPGKKLKKLNVPMMVGVCEKDSVAPPKATIKYAKAAPLCEIKVYPYGHFEIYTDEPFDIITKDQLEFLSRVVPQ